MRLECKYDDTDNVITVAISNSEGGDNYKNMLLMLSNLIRTHHAAVADLCQWQVCEEKRHVDINCPPLVAETIKEWVEKREINNVSRAPRVEVETKAVGIFEELGRVDAMLARAKRLLPTKDLRVLMALL